MAREAAELGCKQAHHPGLRIFCKHAISTIMDMPSNTTFGSVTIAVSKQYLNQLFGHIDHPVVASVLEARDSLVLETAVSPEIIDAAGQMLHYNLPENLESHYYKLKCEELLCYVFAMLTQREHVSPSVMHIADIKAIYSIKNKLLLHLDEQPDIAGLAAEASMSEPKLRKLFKQTFGKSVFEYYQSARMVEAARLLRGQRLSVSEVGYRLGFTNLSHFSRVFEQHMGMKPKSTPRLARLLFEAESMQFYTSAFLFFDLRVCASYNFSVKKSASRKVLPIGISASHISITLPLMALTLSRFMM